MNRFVKTGLVLIAVLAVIYFGERIYTYVSDFIGENQRLHEELVGQKQEFEKLSLHAAKLGIQYVNEKELREKLQKEFETEKEALKGRIKVLSNATFIIRERARRSGKSDLVYQGKKLKYIVNEIRFNQGPPVGYVLIFDDGRVVSKLYNHRINIKTATARDESTGKYTIISKADFELRSPSINVNGEENWYKKPYPLKIYGGQAFIDPTERNQLRPKFQWWAPNINGGLSFGVGAPGVFVRPTLNMSFSGFGTTKNDLDWKFLHLGFDSDTELRYPGAHFMPFSYRFWPQVLRNTYVGPGVGWNPLGVNAQINLSVGF